MSVETRQEHIAASEFTTNRLMALALSLPTVPGKSELFGRDSAFYAIGADRAQAIEFMLNSPDDSVRRRMASRALAMAGYDAADILAMGEGSVTLLSADF